MIVVMQCAGSKRENAGSLKTKAGQPVSFVTHPEFAPVSAKCVYARPDDISDNGVTWREQLVSYNGNPGINSLGLLPAFELYENAIYRALANRNGVPKTYILSAGWGLIPASFLTPSYDITFSSHAETYVRRRERDPFQDLAMIP